MAETANAPKAPAAPPPAPAPAAAHTGPRPSSQILKGITRLFSVTVCVALGLGFIFLGILVRLRPDLIPGALKPTLAQLFPHLPYFIVGIGLFFLGMTRSMAVQELVSEYRKNRHYPHAWKIPLVGFQAFLLETVCFIYALPVGLGWYPPVESLMVLVWAFFLVLLYALWYVTAHARNRFPSIAGLRMAVVTLALSVGSFLLWWAGQLVFPALLVGLLGIFALVTAILVRVKGVEQVGGWPKITLLVVSVLLLAHVTYYAVPFGKPTADLVDLKLATKSLPGEVQSMDYFSAADHSKDEVAFSEKSSDGWFLQVNQAIFSQQNPENPLVPSFKMQAGDEAFHPVFVKNGSFVMADMAKNGGRGLWKVNADNGKAVLLRGNIEPLEDGSPWSETRGEFLYVTHPGDSYHLNVLNLATGKSKLLLSSENPIHTPSWVRPLNPPHNAKGLYPEIQVAYADGVHGLFYVVDLKTKTREPLMSEEEKSLDEKLVADGKVGKVLPAPDGFRYLYLSDSNGRTTLWLVLADGTKRVPIYQTTAEVRHLAWNSNGQQILIEEIHHGWDMGFLRPSTTARLLDANLGTCQYLIPPQISAQAPALASDGVKVAFVAGEGLWYPSAGQGIWVAALR